MSEDTSFTESFDALVWAKAFVRYVRANPSIATDESTMLGWFANALMRGYDKARADADLRAAPAAEPGAAAPAAPWEPSELLAAATEMLYSFQHEGHPGRQCVQSGWIEVERVAKWRDIVERAGAPGRAAPTEPVDPTEVQPDALTPKTWPWVLMTTASGLEFWHNGTGERLNVYEMVLKLNAIAYAARAGDAPQGGSQL